MFNAIKKHPTADNMIFFVAGSAHDNPIYQKSKNL